jgi:hypothetical protein
MSPTYTFGVPRNRSTLRWPVRRFVVVEDSMRPTLTPGDGLLAVRWPRVESGQLRVFPDPTMPTRWLIKRVGQVRGAGRAATFEATSDNPGAVGVVDSRRFGWVPAAGSYRVIWTVRGA